MDCNYPVTIFDKTQGKFIEVPCGKCIFCQSQLSRDWQLRLKKEFNFKTFNFFITLTYDEDHLPYLPYIEAISNINFNRKFSALKTDDYNLLLSNLHSTNYSTDSVPSLCPRDICNFFKRFRQNIKRTNDERFTKQISIKYYAVGEYGPQTFRPHYHVIVGFSFGDYPLHEFLRCLKLQKRWQQQGSHVLSLGEYVSFLCTISWQNGFNKVDILTDERINYCSKYVNKFTDSRLIEYFNSYPGLIKPFKRSSNGIGEQYVVDNLNVLSNKNSVSVNGHQNHMPRYMRKKIIENLPPDQAQEYKERTYFTDEKRNLYLINRLHDYLSLNNLPLHNDINDPGFIRYLDDRRKEKENKIKQQIFKKRKL